jgi:hypothetical protein
MSCLFAVMNSHSFTISVCTAFMTVHFIDEGSFTLGYVSIVYHNHVCHHSHYYLLLLFCCCYFLSLSSPCFYHDYVTFTINTKTHIMIIIVIMNSVTILSLLLLILFILLHPALSKVKSNLKLLPK